MAYLAEVAHLPQYQEQELRLALNESRLLAAVFESEATAATDLLEACKHALMLEDIDAHPAIAALLRNSIAKAEGRKAKQSPKK